MYTYDILVCVPGVWSGCTTAVSEWPKESNGLPLKAQSQTLHSHARPLARTDALSALGTGGGSTRAAGGSHTHKPRAVAPVSPLDPHSQPCTGERVSISQGEVGID